MSIVIFRDDSEVRIAELARIMGWSDPRIADGAVKGLWKMATGLGTPTANASQIAAWCRETVDPARIVAALEEAQLITRKGDDAYMIRGVKSEIKRVESARKQRQEAAEARWKKQKKFREQKAPKPDTSTDSGECGPHCGPQCEEHAARNAQAKSKSKAKPKAKAKSKSKAKPTLSIGARGSGEDDDFTETAERLVHAVAGGQIEHLSPDDAAAMRKGYGTAERFFAAMNRIFADREVTMPEALATKQVAKKLLATRDYPDPAAPAPTWKGSLDEQPEDDHAHQPS